MKKTKIQFIFLTILLVAGPALAQDEPERQTVEYGNIAVEYSEKIEVDASQTAYYLDNLPVLSVFDTNNDSRGDLWLQYDEKGLLKTENSDSDFDGQIDTIREFDAEENIISSTTPEFKLEEIILPDNPNPQKIDNNSFNNTISKINKANKVDKLEPFALNPPPEKNKFSIPIKWIIFIGSLAAILSIFFLKKKKN